MKIWKDLTSKAVITAERKPDGLWREADEHELRAYKAYVDSLMTSLEKAVERKSSLLRA